jgi:hypothetical protein
MGGLPGEFPSSREDFSGDTETDLFLVGGIPGFFPGKTAYRGDKPFDPRKGGTTLSSPVAAREAIDRITDEKLENFTKTYK